MDTETIKVADPKKGMSGCTLIIILCIIVAVIRIISGIGAASTPSNVKACDCEIIDGAGNKKLIMAGGYKDCTELYKGEYKGGWVNCK